jgi:8-oxo-dGTP pyrophosphatase MutT (NUDIX family)
MTLKHQMIRLFWRSFFRPYARLSRGMTLGARILVIDQQDRVLLVKQSYSPHWILPGGGIERGETMLEGGLRELREEAGVVAKGEATLLGIFSNHAIFPGDHVACYVLREFEQESWKPNAEITAAEFFSRTALPELVNKGSRTRIAEVLEGATPSPYWSEP